MWFASFVQMFFFVLHVFMFLCTVVRGFVRRFIVKLFVPDYVGVQWSVVQQIFFASALCSWLHNLLMSLVHLLYSRCSLAQRWTSWPLQ